MLYTVRYESRLYGSTGIFTPMNWDVEATGLWDAVGKAADVAHAARYEIRNPVGIVFAGVTQKLTPHDLSRFRDHALENDN